MNRQAQDPGKIEMMATNKLNLEGYAVYTPSKVHTLT